MGKTKQLNFKEILPHVKLETPLAEIVQIKKKKFEPIGLLPQHTTESVKKMIGVTMQDLFFLERPKTYADLNNLINRYEFEVLISLEEVV